jgi:putative endonuclease
MNLPKRSFLRHPERRREAPKSKDPVALRDAPERGVNLPPAGTGDYWIYILTNERRTVLYIGVTNDLQARLAQHIRAEGGGFTSRNRTSFLVYYENYPDPAQAIAREKQLKGWTRAKKVVLISKVNSEFVDLASILFGEEWRGAVLAGGVDAMARDPSTPALRASAQDDAELILPNFGHPERSAGGKAGEAQSKDPVPLQTGDLSPQCHV